MKPCSEAAGNWKAGCIERCLSGLGRGRWRRASAREYLAGGLLHKNLTEVLPPILGRCFAELPRPMLKDQEAPLAEPAKAIPAQPPSPGKAAPSRQAEARRLARQEERNVRYHQVRALREQG